MPRSHLWHGDEHSQPRNLKIFCTAWPLHHSGVFTSICCFAQGTMQKNLSASPWLPSKPNRGLWKYPRKERLSGIGWKCVQMEASLPNLLKCKLRGKLGPGSEPSGLLWKTSSSTCQAFRDSVLAHDHVHSSNSAE